MKLLKLLLILALIQSLIIAQPMSGNYSIGGETPDFQTITDAVTSLKSNGIDGAVTFYLRPGIYRQPSAEEPVLNIDAVIIGVSDTTRITFQPDVTQGGTVENVALETQSPATGLYEGAVVTIQSDYITLRNLTIQNADTTENSTIAPMIYATAASGNSDLTSISIIGCDITGMSENSRSLAAFSCSVTSYDVTLQNNTVNGTHDGFLFPTQSATTYTVSIIGNHLSNLQSHLNNLSAEVGTVIQIGRSDNARVESNTIDYSGGSSGGRGIALSGAKDFIIDSNHIFGVQSGNGVGPNDNYTGIAVNNYNRSAQGGLISNNMVAGINANVRVGISVKYGSGFRVYHNSVVFPARGIASWTRAGTLYLNTEDCSVINNIFIDLSTEGNRVAALQVHDTTGLFIDYNNIIVNDVLLASTTIGDFQTLEEWAMNGYDEHSVSTMPTFVSRAEDLHLSECSVADDSLRGIGVQEITADIDGETRDSEAPFMGADEAEGEIPQVFEMPEHYPAGDGSWLFTTADLDGDNDLDFAVSNAGSNGGSNNVSLLWNDGSGHFSVADEIPFGTDPGVIKAGDLNEDSILDLVVDAFDTVFVRFGTGGGNFGDPVVVESGLAILDVELADYDIDNDLDLIMLHSPSTDSGYVQIRINDGDGNFTWNNIAEVGLYLDDLALADLNNDDFVDLLVVDNTRNQSLYTLLNLGVHEPGISRGFGPATEYAEHVHSTPQHSNFLVRDFDGDSDIDVILGDALSVDSLILLRNNGDGTFGMREPFQVHGRKTPRVSTAFDYEGDGDIDIATGNFTSDTHLLLNDGTGGFQLMVMCENGELPAVPQAILSGPIDGDNSPDLAVLTTNDSITVLRNLHWIPSGNLESTNQPVISKFQLHQNYPNPFNPTTTIKYGLPQNAPVNLIIYDLNGCEVWRYHQTIQSAGWHQVQWNGVNSSGEVVSTGVYFYRLQAGDYSDVKKMVLMK